MNARRILKIAVLVAAVYFFSLSLILGFWLISERAEVSALNDYVAVLSNRIIDSKKNKPDISLNSNDISKLTFEDSGFNVKFEHPASWSVSIRSKVSDKFSAEPYGWILTDYLIEVAKNESILSVTKRNGVGSITQGLLKNENEVVNLTDKIFRYRYTKDDANSNIWYYVVKDDCNNILAMDEGADISKYIVCHTGGFFHLGFGDAASSVMLKSSIAEDIKEADEIVLSSLSK